MRSNVGNQSQETLFLFVSEPSKAKHKIANCQEKTVYQLVNRHNNLPVYEIKPHNEPGKTWVVHWNVLLPVAHPSQDLIEEESDDSDYDTPPIDEDELSRLLPQGPMTRSHTEVKLMMDIM